MGIICGSGRLDSDCLQELCDSFLYVGVGDTLLMELYRLRDLIAHLVNWIHRVHGPLEYDGDSLPSDLSHLAVRKRNEVLSLKHDLSLSDIAALRQNSKQGKSYRTLTGTRLSSDPEGFSLLHTEANVLDRSYPPS